jgi:hypothetical protein
MVTIALEDSPTQEAPPAKNVEVSSQQPEAEPISTSSTKDRATTSAEVPTNLTDQDTLVFGSLNRELTDFLAERVRLAVEKEIVKGLPLLEDEDVARHQLQEKLVYKFVRNIDVLEVYCEHNVLTLRKFPPAKRKRIAQVMLQGKESLPDIAFPPMTVNTNEGTSAALPTKDMIPSQIDMDSLRQELQQLQLHLEAARSTRNNLLLERHSLDTAQRTIGKIARTLEQHSVNTSSAPSEVNARVTDGNSVRHLTQEAQAIMDNLDARKEKRKQMGENGKGTDDDDSNDNPFFASPVVAKQPRLSLEEAYRRDCQQLGLRDTTNTVNGQDNKSSENLAEAVSTLPVSKLHALKQMLKSRTATERYHAENY